MRNRLPITKIIFASALTLISLQASAIEIKVKSIAKPVMGLGFTVNGKQYGGLGSSYRNSNVPAGSYKFGVRASGDVGCTMNGKQTIDLKKDTTVYLRYDGQRCRLQLSKK